MHTAMLQKFYVLTHVTFITILRNSYYCCPYKWGKWGTEELKNLLKFIHLVNETVRFKPKKSICEDHILRNLCSFAEYLFVPINPYPFGFTLLRSIVKLFGSMVLHFLADLGHCVFTLFLPTSLSSCFRILIMHILWSLILWSLLLLRRSLGLCPSFFCTFFLFLIQFK